MNAMVSLDLHDVTNTQRHTFNHTLELARWNRQSVTTSWLVRDLAAGNKNHQIQHTLRHACTQAGVSPHQLTAVWLDDAGEPITFDPDGLPERLDLFSKIVRQGYLQELARIEAHAKATGQPSLLARRLGAPWGG